MKTCDIAVIGGGVMGLSVAGHLAERRAGAVLLIEKRFIGAGASGKSGAIVRQHYSTPLLVRMARHGLLAFRDREMSQPGAMGWEQAGCLIVASQADRAAAAGNVCLMREAGADARLLEGGELEEVLPDGVFAPGDAGAWEPEAGYLDAARVLHTWAADASALGVEVLLGMEVTGFVSSGGKLAGLATTGDSVSCGAAVMCAGPWAAPLARTAGIELPINTIGPEIAFWRLPEDRKARSWPVVADLEHGFYCRPDPGGRLLTGALDVSSDPVIGNPDLYDESSTGGFFDWCRERVGARLPFFRRAFVRGGYRGLYAVTPDSHPLIGEAAELAGLFIAAGFSGHGFKLAPAVGRAVAERVIDGAYTTLDLSPLRLSRYADGAPIRAAYEYGVLS